LILGSSGKYKISADRGIKAKSPLQRAFPGFPYSLLVVVGDMCANDTCTLKFYITL